MRDFCPFMCKISIYITRFPRGGGLKGIYTCMLFREIINRQSVPSLALAKILDPQESCQLASYSLVTATLVVVLVVGIERVRPIDLFHLVQFVLVFPVPFRPP